MVTELWLADDEFQTASVTPGSRITFCLKEFRVRPHPGAPLPGHPSAPQPPLCPQGLLTFAEASNLPLTVHYDAPGR